MMFGGYQRTVRKSIRKKAKTKPKVTVQILTAQQISAQQDKERGKLYDALEGFIAKRYEKSFAYDPKKKARRQMIRKHGPKSLGTFDKQGKPPKEVAL